MEKWKMRKNATIGKRENEELQMEMEKGEWKIRKPGRRRSMM
jgi:hypothetical protein